MGDDLEDHLCDQIEKPNLDPCDCACHLDEKEKGND